MRLKALVLRMTLSAMALQVSLQALPQGGCPNTNFENGDFSGWTGMTGYCCPINVTNAGIINGRQTIMSGAGMDPITNNVVSVVAPGGGLHSARLGNSEVDSEAEQLSYTMFVDESNALFVYRYAVVLQDPQHDPSEQPRFQIRMFDESGAPIDCGIYNVTATSGIPGFITTFYEDDILIYKDWTTVGMDLTAYAGQNVTIEFSTGDCSLGGHFAYAYIECYCSALEITSNFCPGLESTTLEAPPGFASYQWSTGETTQSISIDSPTTGQEVTVTLTSVTGCNATLSTILTPSVVLADFASVGDCMNNVQFSDSSVVVSGPDITTWSWNFGDGTSDEQHPFHAFSTPGSHVVELVVYSNLGCPDTLTQVINLLPSPVVDFTYGTPCLGEPVTLVDVTPAINSVVTRNPDLGDSTTSSAVSVTHIYDAVGVYDVTLFIQDSNGCSDSLVVPITVSPAPLVDLGLNDETCPEQEIMLTAAGAAESYLWNTQETTASITIDAPGTYWVEAIEGICAARDTVTFTATPNPGQLATTVLNCPGESTALTIPYSNGTYMWATGDTTQSIMAGTVGFYPFTLIDSHGCTYSDIAQLVLDPLALGITVPNVITPNGDGFNDQFEPVSGSPLVEVRIFNRWGLEVFNSPSLHELWDGEKDGGPVADGTYYYEVRYWSSCAGATQLLRGELTVLR